jgi:hypothetical protein
VGVADGLRDLDEFCVSRYGASVNAGHAGAVTSVVQRHRFTHTSTTATLQQQVKVKVNTTLFISKEQLHKGSRH